jgi:hypothetical protein
MNSRARWVVLLGFSAIPLYDCRYRVLAEADLSSNQSIAGA